MAKLLNKDQRLVVGALSPKPVYSRVISCGAFLTMVGAYNFGYTPMVGQSLWLLGITIWLSCNQTGDTHNTIFDITSGTSEPQTWQEVRDWEKLVPIETRAGFPWHETFNPKLSCHWDIVRKFENVGRRFGIWAMTSAEAGGIIEASFEISEG